MKITKFKQGGDIPLPRCGHKSVVYKDSIYVFGGNTQDKLTNLNQLYKYNIFTQTWTIIDNLKDDIPLKRTAHAMLVYKDTMYCFSGALGNPEDFFEISTFNFTTNEWKKVSDEIQDRPESRYGHTAVLYENKALIFGGCSNFDHQQFLEVIEFDLDELSGTWNITRNGKIKCMSFHTSDADVKRKVIYHFGGLKWVGDYDMHSNDLTAYFPEKRKWEIIQPKTYCFPCERRSHGSCLGDDGSLFIFGGFLPKEGFLNDLWKFDFKINQWTELKYQGEISQRRYFSISKYENGFFIFGGVHNEIRENQKTKLFLMNDLYRVEWTNRVVEMKSNINEVLKNGHFSDLILIYEK